MCNDASVSALLPCGCAVKGPMCLSADGTAVDWWVALKLPGGDEIAYLDSNAAAALYTDARFT